ncbi:putative reverse transcriptase domain-containing protein [Tanacetum coccineum]|uniref:Reverse transcriptase domain-containing protein n=1 Tax=Tanacetum coccineum TaxID=301880 RepID=A0ABQ4YLP1_9ASTR
MWGVNEVDMDRRWGYEALTGKGLPRWFEKMETVFHVSNCAVECQTNAYYSRNEIQKLENELWNLTVKGTDIVSYTQHFQELALLCLNMVLDKEEKIKGNDAHVTEKKTKDKSKEKRLEDVPTIQDLLEVFPEDFPRLPLTEKVEFQIDLVLGVVTVARAPYRLAPSEMKELSDQFAPILALQEGTENFVVYCDTSHKGLTVFTDHKSLQHILDQKDLNMRQRRWLELPSDYDCEIRYHPGKSNTILNAQAEAMKEENVKEENLYGMNKEFKTRPDGTLCIEKQSWLPDMLHTYVIDFGNGWDKHLPLAEFSYNNSYHTSIKAALFEAPYDFDDKLHFVKEPVEIMDREVKWLKQSRILIIKVRWNSRRGPKFTWECEDQFRSKYSHLFTNTTPVGKEN